jgi:hypothetical protein
LETTSKGPEKRSKTLAIILSIVLIALLSEHYILTTSKFEVEINPPILKASENSELSVTVLPMNNAGFRTPFRKIEIRFQIEEGNSLISIIKEDKNGTLIIKSKGIEGEAVIGIYNLSNGLLLKKISVKILPRDVT